MRKLGLLLSLVTISAPASAHAGGAECGCDHEIAPGTGEVNGSELGVMPGDVVCVMAGDYEFIRFREIRGEEGNPVVVKNCGGIVSVRNEDRAYAIDFQGSSHHFHLTGTGDPESELGFRVSAPDREPYPGIGLWFLDKSTDYEVDHIEVYETGFAGVMAKTDPLCDGSADQDVFIQKNVHLHHLWVHDTGGEGFYVGSTQSNGHTITCNNAPEVHQPHFLEGIEIDHVLVEDTEWDGMQVGMARADCRVHDNIIRRVGTAGVEYQQQGFQNGTFSSCDVRRNILSDGPQMGIIVLGSHDSTFADNVIMRFGADGIYANLGETAGPRTYRMVHNTIGEYGGAAIRVFGPDLEDSVAWNNFVIGASDAIQAANDVGWAAEGNVFAATVADGGFVGENDFHLTATSPARGAGFDHAADGFDTDLDGLLRASPPAAGAYEFVDDSPTTASVGGGGAGIPGGDGGGSSGGAPATGGGASQGGGSANDDSEGGCSCRVGARESSSSYALAAAVIAALATRRRR
jgi:MYXO-CTERM domain-containing protein